VPPPILLRHLEINDGALLTLYRVSADTDNMGWRRNKNLAATCFCALDDALPDLVTGYYCASRPLKVFQFKCSWIFDSFFSRGPTFFFLIVVDVLPTSLHERHQPLRAMEGAEHRWRGGRGRGGAGGGGAGPAAP